MGGCTEKGSKCAAALHTHWLRQTSNLSLAHPCRKWLLPSCITTLGKAVKPCPQGSTWVAHPNTCYMASDGLRGPHPAVQSQAPKTWLPWHSALWPMQTGRAEDNERAQSPGMASGQTGKHPGNQEFRKRGYGLIRCQILGGYKTHGKWMRVRKRNQQEHWTGPKQYPHLRYGQTSLQITNQNQPEGRKEARRWETDMLSRHHQTELGRGEEASGFAVACELGSN